MPDPDLTRGRELLAAYQCADGPGWIWTQDVVVARAAWHGWLRTNGPALLDIGESIEYARVEVMRAEDAFLRAENARLTEQLAAVTEERDTFRGEYERAEASSDAWQTEVRACCHPSSTGVDQTPLRDPGKVWRCDACGSLHNSLDVAEQNARGET